MRKVLLAAIFAVTCFISIQAQSDESRFHIGVGPTVALSIGNFGDAYSFGIGGEVRGEYMFCEKFSGIINLGYARFKGKKGYVNQERYPRLNLIPVLIGIRAYPGTKFFVGVRAGMGIGISEGDAYGWFAYSPEIGYNGQVIQVTFAFNSRTKNGYSSNHLGLTAIYVFGKK